MPTGNLSQNNLFEGSRGASPLRPIDRFIRPKEFAAILSVSLSTLYRMVEQDLIPKPMNIGIKRAYAWPLSQVNAVIEQIKQANGS